MVERIRITTILIQEGLTFTQAINNIKTYKWLTKYGMSHDDTIADIKRRIAEKKN